MKQQGKQGPKLVLWVHYVFSPSSSLSIYCGHRPCTIYCGHGGQCSISMDSLHDPLRPAMVIDGLVSQTTVSGNVYRITVSPAYRYFRRLLLPSFQIQYISPTVYIDTHVQQFIYDQLWISVDIPPCLQSNIFATVEHSRHPRWLGRWLACLSRSIWWVQVSPSACSQGFFSHKKKMIIGKRESVSQLHSMKIDEQWEC